MRKFLHKILEILDGTPAVYGKKQVGQSLIEMAFVTPLLIILIAGVAEVGWLANNYIVLMEVTRVGARRATTLSGSTGVLEWDDDASLAPGVEQPPNASREQLRQDYRWNFCADPTNNQQYAAFYNIIVCTMLRSIDPLPFRNNNGIDDIAISVFALQKVTNPIPVTYPAPTGLTNVTINAANFPGLGVPASNYPTGDRIYVVGRYPDNANECNLDPSGNLIASPPERDPFDWIQDVRLTCLNCASTPIYAELTQGFDPPTTKEKQRGFVWFAQHKVVQDTYNTVAVDCYGSQWTIKRAEDLMNLTDPQTGANMFNLNATQKTFLPNHQALVVVEIFWKHELLLAFPLFSPVYTMLGPNTTLSVWSAFPASPSAEPNIRFSN